MSGVQKFFAKNFLNSRAVALKSLHPQHFFRDFPWRHTKNPYHILVSEIMLQQTQVERVVPFYTKFLKRFPTAKKLAQAKLASVLHEWQGLGYNRRAKYLHNSAKILCSGEINTTSTPPQRIFASKFSVHFLESLPGVGPYTARAVAVFAYNRPEVFIETNIRTVFLHHFFSPKYKGPASLLVTRPVLAKVSDKEILPLVGETLKRSGMQPRRFYALLMDYGAYLKQQGITLNSKSKHYTKQSKFEGSSRQLRGAILRELLKSPTTVQSLQTKIKRSMSDIKRELARLQKEKLITKKGRKFDISN